MQLQVKISSKPAQIINFDSYIVIALKNVAYIASNIASLYDTLAKGNTEKYAIFESTAQTHRLLDRIENYAVIQ